MTEFSPQTSHGSGAPRTCHRRARITAPMECAQIRAAPRSKQIGGATSRAPGPLLRRSRGVGAELRTALMRGKPTAPTAVARKFIKADTPASGKESAADLQRISDGAASPTEAHGAVRFYLMGQIGRASCRDRV